MGTASTVRRVSSCPCWMARSMAVYRYRPETIWRVTRRLLGQLMQCVLHIDVQGARQFIGEISARGTIDECLGGGQQRAELREPDVCLRPQSVVVEAGDFTQGIVSAAMGVAGEVIQRLEFAEDRDIDGGAEGLFQFVEGGDLVAQQQRAQFIGAEGERSHNVIVPV